MMKRRSFLLGVASALAAPAVVRAEFLMPVKRIIWPDDDLFAHVNLLFDGSGDYISIPDYDLNYTGMVTKVRITKGVARYAVGEFLPR